MNHQKALHLIAAALPAFSQQDPKSQIEPSYEAVLQVVIGSDQAGELPQGLAPITRQLRSNFGFSGYRLANTFIGRFSPGGSLEYKSVADIFGQPQDSAVPTFLDWTMGRLRVAQDERGQTMIQAEPFRFGARVPVRVGQPNAEAVNYETVGLTTMRLGLPAGRPTLVGTLSLPKTSGTMFLVLTVRPADN
jgi:hypothetical protein